MKRIKQLIKGYIITKQGPYSELAGVLTRLRQHIIGTADVRDVAIFDDIAADILDLVQAKPAKDEVKS